ncbi:MAG TPA: SHOCT domain-containing protein [Candidatus Nitrosotenuis sp.]|nr:SHOCT domain-containing protein [Candidatus Nitrosotenuis sp.]
MAKKKQQPGYIEKFLKRADKAVDEALNQGVKRADAILADAVAFGKIAAKEADQKSRDLRKQASIESTKLKARGEKEVVKGLSAARRLASTDKQDLETLAKLGELRKAGIITESEFQTKKKKILGRI